MIEEFRNIMKISFLKKTSFLKNCTQEAQFYCILKRYLEYGVLRSSEILNYLITDTEKIILLIMLILKVKSLLLIIIKMIQRDQ
jgi:hypothetical protein